MAKEPASAIDSQLVREVLLSRLGQLERLSYTCKFELTRKFDQIERAEFAKSSGYSILPVKDYRINGTIIYAATDNRHFYYQWLVNDESAKTLADSGNVLMLRDEVAAREEFVEKLSAIGGEPYAVGAVQNERVVGGDDPFAVALGLRVMGADTNRITTQQLKDATVDSLGGGIWRIVVKDKMAYPHTFEVDQAKDFALVSYRLASSPSLAVYQEIRPTKWEQHNGIPIPIEFEMRTVKEGKSERVRDPEVWKVKVSKFACGADVDAKLPTIQWPKGAMVADARSGTYFKISGDNVELTDQWLTAERDRVFKEREVELQRAKARIDAVHGSNEAVTPATAPAERNTPVTKP